MILKNFKDFINEATMIDRGAGNHPIGTKLVFLKTPNKKILSVLKSVVGADLKNMSISSSSPDEITAGSGDREVNILLGDVNVKLLGSKKELNSTFAMKPGNGGKSETHRLTRAKESVSLIIFRSFQNDGKILTFDEVEEQLSEFSVDANLLSDVYYESAILQLKSFKLLRNIKGKTYKFEFQGDELSKHIYDKSKKLTGISQSDNWNPGDLWLFNTQYTSNVVPELSKIDSANELNFWIRKNFLLGNIVSISLKQASKGKSTIQIINPSKFINKKIKYDFTLKKIKIASSLKSLFIETVSGFEFKANSRAAGDSTNIFLEGTFKQENFSMGAVPKPLWDKFHGGKIISGNKIKKSDFDRLLTVGMNTFKKYKHNMLKSKGNFDVIFTDSFDDFDDTLKRRYIGISQYLKFVMENYDESMKFAFFGAMKVSNLSSMYVKIK